MNWKRRAALFLCSQGVTLFGSTLVQMAIVWYVTVNTDSGAWVAAFTVCAYLPQFLISFLGGVWADRYSRKLLIIGADVVIATTTLAMFILMPFIGSETGLLSALLVLSALRSLGAGIQTPAVNATLPLIVPEDKLMRCNGINATIQSLMQFLAPAAAGLILQYSSLRSSLLVDLGTALPAILLMLFVAIPKPERNAADSEQRASVFEDMKAGLAYSFSNALIKKLLIIYGLFIFFSVPGGFLAQLFVSRNFGEGYWYLSAVELVGFAGMSGGGLLMGVWGGFKRRELTLALGLVVFGLLAVGMGLSQSFILYLVIMLVYGIALTTVQTATTTLIQENTEPQLCGRVFGLMGTMYAGFLPLGMALFGPLADVLPLRGVIIATGAVLAALGVAAQLRTGEKKAV